MKEVKKRIKEIEEQIKQLNVERTSLIEQCKHPKYRIGTYSWRIGCYNKKQICNVCDTVIGDPTEEEIKQFNEEDNQGQGIKEYNNLDK